MAAASSQQSHADLPVPDEPATPQPEAATVNAGAPAASPFVMSERFNRLLERLQGMPLSISPVTQQLLRPQQACPPETPCAFYDAERQD